MRVLVEERVNLPIKALNNFKQKQQQSCKNKEAIFLTKGLLFTFPPFPSPLLLFNEVLFAVDIFGKRDIEQHCLFFWWHSNLWNLIKNYDLLWWISINKDQLPQYNSDNSVKLLCILLRNKSCFTIWYPRYCTFAVYIHRV